MAKAVLIMDMPESCDMCDLVENQPSRMHCGVPGIGENVTDYIACRPEFKRGICMKDTKNFRTMDCNGCQCNDCYECASANCDICYRAEFASESDKDMYHMTAGIKNCDFD